MLMLSLLRHAKSSWHDRKLADADRPLNPRGETSVRKIRAFLKREALQPDLILCSSAVRTRQTLAAIMDTLGPDAKVGFEDELYLATPTALLQRIRRVPKKVRHLALIGHNPGFHALALDLTEIGRKADIVALARKFPTAGLAVLTFEVDRWDEVRPASGRLLWFVSPKILAVAAD